MVYLLDKELNKIDKLKFIIHQTDSLDVFQGKKT